MYFDKGKEGREINKRRYDELIKHKEDIERGFGNSLKLERLDERKACRISYWFPNGLLNKDKWDEVQNSMIDGMIRLEKAFRKYIKKLK